MRQVAEAGAAVVGAHRHAEQPEFAQFAPQIPRKHVAAVDLIGARRDALLREALRLFAHGVDDFAEPEIELAVCGIGHSPVPHCHRTPNRWIIGLSDNFATLTPIKPMAQIVSKIDIRSQEFADNRAAMTPLVDDLRATLQRNAAGGSAAARDKHSKSGKLLARERIVCLLDPGSPFLELSALAAQGVYGEDLPGAGLITGIGRVSGRECMVVANDPTVKGGTYYPLTVKKHLRAQEIAGDNRLPCIYLVESGGAFLPRQDEVFPDREHFGRIFFNQARLVRAGHRADCGGARFVHRGRCLRAGDVRSRGHRAQSGAGVSRRSALGESGDRRGNRRGILGRRGRALPAFRCDRLLCGERYPCAGVRAPRGGAAAARRRCAERRAAPAVNRRTIPAELYGIIPPSSRKPYDVRELIARLVDRSWFDEFKALYGTTLVCGFADIHGSTVGILANNGILFSESALKGTHFIELCCREAIPLVFLQNISGFMVGQAAEAGGIAKDGAKLVTAVACAAVPKYTVVIGGSFGAGNYAMCGRAYSPRFLFQWPNARTSVMGGEQAASVLATIKREGLERAGGTLSAAEEEQLKAPIREQFERQGHPYYASARLWDDGVIDPLDTRRVLGLALALTQRQDIAATRFGVFRM